DHVARVGFDVRRAARLAHLLDAAVDVHPAVARVQQDRANRARGPRAAAATSGRRCRHTFFVQAMRDLLDAAIGETVVVDAAHDLGLGFVDDRDRVLAARRVALANERVAEATPTRDAAIADA